MSGEVSASRGRIVGTNGHLTGVSHFMAPYCNDHCQAIVPSPNRPTQGQGCKMDPVNHVTDSILATIPLIKLDRLGCQTLCGHTECKQKTRLKWNILMGQYLLNIRLGPGLWPLSFLSSRWLSPSISSACGRAVVPRAGSTLPTML